MRPVGVWLGSLAPLAVMWGASWTYLAAEWRANPHYEYGWGVPLLGLVLAWRRWTGVMWPASSGWGPGSLGLVGIAVWVVGEMVRRHDPIWRLAGGLLLAGSTLGTIAWLWRVGGWPLLKRQGWPLLFAWTALPWPMPLELATTQALLHFVTTAAVLVLTAVGIPALQTGSVIHLATSAIGVEEACSGLQSLQAALMAALFLGEFYRLAGARRLGLLFAGVLLALVGNFLRVLALVAVVRRGGSPELHDWIGGLATGAIFLGLIGVAWWLREERMDGTPPPEKWTWPAPRMGGVLAMLLVALIWSGRPAGAVSRPPLWPVAVNRLPEGWRAEFIHPSRKERAMLRFSEAAIWRLTTAEGEEAQLYHFTWEPGEGMPPLAFTHTPGMCLPWSGWAPLGVPVEEKISIRGREIPAIRYAFALGHERLVAFQMVSAGGVARPFTVFQFPEGQRWQRLLSTWRAPREILDEEILLYVPLRPGRESGSPVAAQIFEAVLPGAP